MRNLLSLAIALALPVAAAAGEPACVVSFSGAQQNVCDGTTSTTTPGMSRLLSLAAVQDSTLRIVKFDGPVTKDQRERVEAAGARIISYAPHYAYIVRMAPALDARMRAIDGVIWSGPMLPALKIDANVFAELKSGGIVDSLGIELLEITFDTPAGGTSMRSAMNSVPGLTVANVMEKGGETSVRATFNRAQLSSAIEEVAQRDDVLSVGFRKNMRISNSQGQWLHQSNKNTPQPQTPVFDRGIYGCGQIIGELDTGLHMDNVAFKDASQPMPIDICTTGSSCPVIALPNYAARKVVAYYKWSGLAGGTWADNHGHGTHVAGSIIGNDNVANPGTDCTNLTTPGGNSNLDGMAPGAKLVMQESGGNLAYLNDHGGSSYHAADVAWQNGARIHSDSWGGGCTDMFGNCVSGCTVTYDTEARDADRIMNDRPDLLMVFAAGNDATACPSGNNVGSPGNAKNVLTIGATGRGTAGNNMAGFSSRGPTLDSRTKPDLTAQGNAIISASRSANGTTSMSGTSMATPTAAGTAALVRDYLARGFYPSGEATSGDEITEPSGALVKAILATGAAKMTGTGAGANPSQAQGFGRVLLDDSLYFDGDSSRLFIDDAEQGLETSEVASHQFDVVGDGQPLTFVLTWNDVAAAVGASPATVNALRLEVQSPNGDVWTQKLPAGYNVNNANPTQGIDASNYDVLNTLQRIRFDAPSIGTYEVRVRGINVPSGPQKFALAVTGEFDVNSDPTFRLSATPGAIGICAGSPAEYDIGVRSRYGFIDPVTLSVSGLPGATTGNFSLTSVIPADPAAVSHLTIANTAGLSRGNYAFSVDGASTGVEPVNQSIGAQLKVSVGIPGMPALTAPVAGATGLPLSPTFSWATDAAAESYLIEVASDNAFANIIASNTVTTTSWTPSAPLSTLTTYYWRVKANSTCGNSGSSTVRSFTTGVPFPQPYCPVTFPAGVEPITLVKFSLIDNRSATSGGPAHEDFLGVSGGLVEAGEQYEMAVEGNTEGGYTTKVKAYIDWDRNGTFETSEGYSIGDITNSTGVDGKRAIANISVPASVTPGPVRMRVTKKYNAEAPACNNAGYGQAEDYTLMVHDTSVTYTVGGTVSGLSDPSLELSLNGQPAYVVGNGAFVFPTTLADASLYEVTVGELRQEICTVNNASGVIAGADVTNVEVTCAPIGPSDVIFAHDFEIALP